MNTAVCTHKVAEATQLRHDRHRAESDLQYSKRPLVAPRQQAWVHIAQLAHTLMRPQVAPWAGTVVYRAPSLGGARAQRALHRHAVRWTAHVPPRLRTCAAHATSAHERGATLRDG